MANFSVEREKSSSLALELEPENSAEVCKLEGFKKLEVSPKKHTCRQAQVSVNSQVDSCPLACLLT